MADEGPGGGSGIRTHDTVSRIHAFQASAISHSAIPPQRRARVARPCGRAHYSRRAGAGKRCRAAVGGTDSSCIPDGWRHLAQRAGAARPVAQGPSAPSKLPRDPRPGMMADDDYLLRPTQTIRG